MLRMSVLRFVCDPGYGRPGPIVTLSAGGRICTMTSLPGETTSSRAASSRSSAMLRPRSPQPRVLQEPINNISALSEALRTNAARGACCRFVCTRAALATSMISVSPAKTPTLRMLTSSGQKPLQALFAGGYEPEPVAAVALLGKLPDARAAALLVIADLA